MSSFEKHNNTIVDMRVSDNKVYSLSKDKTISVLNYENRQIETGFSFSNMPTCFSVACKNDLMICGFENSYINVDLVDF